MDVFLHFLFPFTLLVLIGLKTEKAIPIALLGITPDLDVLFYIHRSPSHSAVVIFAAFLVLFLVAWFIRREYARYIILGFLATVSHPVFDMLGGYTPILWPLYDKSIMISTQLTLRADPLLRLETSFKISQTPTVFHHLESFQGLVFSGPGYLMALVLVVYVSYRLILLAKHFLLTVKREQ